MLRRFHGWCLFLAVSLAPLPLGANRPWSWTLLAALVGLLCLTWPLVVWRDENARIVTPGRCLVPLVLFAGVIAWAVVQVVPGLPDILWHPLWGEAAAALDPGQPAVVSGRISLDPRAGVEGIMRLMCYGGVFWLALQHGRSSRRAHRLIEGMAITGGLYAAYGLLVQLSGSETILWLEKWAYRGHLTSTFVNRNHFATYAGLTLLCALAAAAQRFGPFRLRLVSVLRHLRRPAMAFAIVAILLAAALGLTGSRAGTASAAIGAAVFLAGAWIAGRPRPRTRAALGVAALALALVALVASLWMALDLTVADAADRQRIYALTLGAIAERPWLGHGLGSFPALFAMHRTTDVTQIWGEAHNTYLELALDLGVPGASALVLAVAWIAGLCVRGILVRRIDGVYPALGFAATTLVGAHALLDFSMQIPAVAATWAAIAGIGVAQSWSSAPRAAEPL